jgi:predicted RNase H-like nuclease (RuvC/YqgF family)
VAEGLCDSLKGQLKEAQSETSALRTQVARHEATIQERDLTISNLKSDLNQRSKENGDLQ